MLSLTIEQYNAYTYGYSYKRADDLTNLIQAAYYNAYWNGASKSKKSPESVVRGIFRELDKQLKHTETPKMDVVAVKKDFERMEALKKYGWCKD